MNFFNPLNIVVFLLSLISYVNDEFTAIRKNILDTYQKHEAERYMGLKSYNLEITENGFLRYKKVQNNNKSELFSVKITRIKDVNFFGTEHSGWCLLQCEPETVIYQSRRDPKGDIDSMANEISFPLQQISAEELSIFKENFIKLQQEIGKIQK